MKLIEHQTAFGQHTKIFEAEVGDIVWFANGSPNYIYGVVIQILSIHNEPYYLIEVDTPMGEWYAVRDGDTITDYKDRPLAWMRGALCG